MQPIVYCLSAQTEPYRALLEAAGVAVRVITGGRVRRALQLRRLLDADGVDVVHAWLFIANAYGWAAQSGPAAARWSPRRATASGRGAGWTR